METARRATAGALPGGEDACLANDTGGSSLIDPYGDPAPDTAYFTLLRPVTTGCSAVGTLDDGVPSQIGSRDAEVAGSSRACP